MRLPDASSTCILKRLGELDTGPGLSILLLSSYSYNPVDTGSPKELAFFLDRSERQLWLSPLGNAVVQILS